MPPRKVPPKERLAELYAMGLSGKEIALQLGLSVSTVSSALSREGISIRTPRETKEMQAQRGVKPKAARFWLGKKQPAEMVERRVAKTRGVNHWLWKGGKHRRPYRGLISKDKCECCDSRQNLGIHHRNFDHYDNAEVNLAILCVSCHMSLHKKSYWDAYHAGTPTPRANGPVGWRKGGDANGAGV